MNLLGSSVNVSEAGLPHGSCALGMKEGSGLLADIQGGSLMKLGNKGRTHAPEAGEIVAQQSIQVTTCHIVFWLIWLFWLSVEAPATSVSPFS